ncbi:hypothetical protein [Sorangium sp. So ce854]|uniref:hypothetical protein n=1 Tax=Sorangium sp. So ce854 TaxID=3133322 RepID=UPI003F60A0C7
MPTSSPLRVNTVVENYSGEPGKAQASALKRLALLFDEIYVTPPTMPTIKNEFINDPECAHRTPEGKLVIHTNRFNYFRDTERSHHLTFESFANPELRDTLIAFEEAGIIKNTQNNQSTRVSKEGTATEIRGQLTHINIRDRQFNSLSGTHPDDYDFNKLILAVNFVKEDTKKADTVYAVWGPQAVFDSFALIDSFLISEILSSSPVFLDRRHRLEISYKYEQLKEGITILQETYPNAMKDFDTRIRFGEVAFSVSNKIFDSNSLASRSPEDIIKYRAEMETSRRRYVSEDLGSLALMIKDEPWSERVRDEIDAYVVGKLNRDIAEYERQSSAAYRKMFGQFAVHATSVVLGGGLGGGIGSLMGNVIPNVSLWQLMLIGSLVGAAREGSQVVKTLVDWWAQKKNDHGSSIAYVAEFGRPQHRQLRNERKRFRKARK